MASRVPPLPAGERAEAEQRVAADRGQRVDDLRREVVDAEQLGRLVDQLRGAVVVAGHPAQLGQVQHQVRAPHRRARGAQSQHPLTPGPAVVVLAAQGAELVDDGRGQRQLVVDPRLGPARPAGQGGELVHRGLDLDVARLEGVEVAGPFRGGALPPRVEHQGLHPSQVHGSSQAGVDQLVPGFRNGSESGVRRSLWLDSTAARPDRSSTPRPPRPPRPIRRLNRAHGNHERPEERHGAQPRRPALAGHRFQHDKPGKGGAVVRTKLKNVESGKTVDKTFNADTKVEIANVDKRHDAVPLQRRHVATSSWTPAPTTSSRSPRRSSATPSNFLLENQEAIVATNEGRVLYIELPASVELLDHLHRAGPAGRLARPAAPSRPPSRPAHEIQVPLFITTARRSRSTPATAPTSAACKS